MLAAGLSRIVAPKEALLLCEICRQTDGALSDFAVASLTQISDAKL